MRNAIKPRRDQSTRHQRPKRPSKLRPTAKASPMDHSKKYNIHCGGGQSNPIEIVDSPEPQTIPEPALDDGELDQFIEDVEAGYDETGEYRAQSPAAQSEISESSLLDDSPLDDDVDDDRPIAKRLGRRSEPQSYAHCFLPSTKRTPRFPNGGFVPGYEDAADSDDEYIEEGGEDELLDDESEGLGAAENMSSTDMNVNPFTAQQDDMDDAIIESVVVAQSPERLRRNPGRANRHTATNLRRTRRRGLQDATFDYYPNSPAEHGHDADPHLVSGGLLSPHLLEESSATPPEQAQTSTREAHRTAQSLSSNTTRKRTPATAQQDIVTMLHASERPAPADRAKVTATAAKICHAVQEFPYLQSNYTMATHVDAESGLPTPPTSTASASTSLLGLTSPTFRLQEHEIPEGGDNANVATIARLRQQLADTTNQLAVERAENASLQIAYDRMARRCQRLSHEMQASKRREGGSGG